MQAVPRLIAVTLTPVPIATPLPLMSPVVSLSPLT
jgi:hypothetical protein